MMSESTNSTNGHDVPKALVHNQQFARIPKATKHKVTLCLDSKFLPKFFIVKKLYIFFNVFSVKILRGGTSIGIPWWYPPSGMRARDS